MATDIQGISVYCFECGKLLLEDDISETTREYIRNAIKNHRTRGYVQILCPECRLRYFDELAKEMKHDD